MKMLLFPFLLLISYSTTFAQQRDTLSIEEAKDRIGENVLIKVNIVDVYSPASKNNKITFLNHTDAHDTIMSFPIYKKHYKRFKNKYLYEGKTVLIKGKVKRYKSKSRGIYLSEIQIKSPSQITILEE